MPCVFTPGSRGPITSRLPPSSPRRTSTRTHHLHVSLKQSRTHVYLNPSPPGYLSSCFRSMISWSHHHRVTPVRRHVSPSLPSRLPRIIAERPPDTGHLPPRLPRTGTACRLLPRSVAACPLLTRSCQVLLEVSVEVAVIQKRRLPVYSPSFLPVRETCQDRDVIPLPFFIWLDLAPSCHYSQPPPALFRNGLIWHRDASAPAFNSVSSSRMLQEENQAPGCLHPSRLLQSPVAVFCNGLIWHQDANGPAFNFSPKQSHASGGDSGTRMPAPRRLLQSPAVVCFQDGN